MPSINKSVQLIIVGSLFILLPWLKTSWVSLDVPDIIKIISSLLGLIIVVIGIYDFLKSATKHHNDEKKEEKIVEESKFNSYNIPCLDSPERKNIIENFLPDLYIPLKDNFLNLACKPACNITSKNPICNTNVFPYVNIHGEVIEKPEFDENRGYRFNGKNMISIQTTQYFPFAKESRTFVFAVYPTERPTIKRPMFFFSYGQRKNHKCGDGHTNHDKSFGVFWGQPAPKEEIEEAYKGIGVRVFFYCEHCKKDRISKNCDTQSLCDIHQLNTWHIFAVTYDGNIIKFYKNGEEIHNQEYSLDTSKTLYLNIGGFVHHDEKGAAIAKDLDYSMNGYIREFMMFKQTLSHDKIKQLSKEIEILVQ